MKTVTATLKACADEKRIRILKLLAQRKMCVCELAHVLNISQPAVSKHIKKMINAGLLTSEQDGFWTNYFINPAHMHAQQLLAVVSKCLNDDPVVVADLKKAQKANRETLCGKT